MGNQPKITFNKTRDKALRKQAMGHQVAAHEMVANLAVFMSMEVYEELCSRHNMFYKLNPDRIAFAKECAPSLIDDARRALAEQLNDPKIPEKEKMEIYEALILDAQLPLANERSAYMVPVFNR